ncbi:MAG: GNAT family N-acetyltransferase [Proteobacteria bacterium]|nr:GNAT family N-acetyltransferase [Pseudomonadota bacterium]
MVINLLPANPGWKAHFSKGFDTPRLEVRPFSDTDLESANAILMERDIYRYVEDLENGNQGRAWFDRVRSKRNYLFLTMKDRILHGMVGLAVLDMCPDTSLRLGGFLGESHWQKGYATDFLLGLKTFLDSSHPSFMVFAHVHENNLGARRALEKAGFRISPESQSDGRIKYLMR